MKIVLVKDGRVYSQDAIEKEIQILEKSRSVPFTPEEREEEIRKIWESGEIHIEKSKVIPWNESEFEQIPKDVKAKRVVLFSRGATLNEHLETIESNLHDDHISRFIGEGTEILAITSTKNPNADLLLNYNAETKASMEKISAIYPHSKTIFLESPDIAGTPNTSFIYQQFPSTENLSDTMVIFDDKKVETARGQISEIAQTIKSKTTSPYEQHLLVLHYLSQYVYNHEDPATQAYTKSRSVSEILESHAKYICCVGYSNFYTLIMKELGFDVSTHTLNAHQIAKVLIKDPKYGINGIYAVDPTNLHRRFDEPGPVFRVNKFANTSLTTLIKNYEEEPFEMKYADGDLQKYSKQFKPKIEALQRDVALMDFKNSDDLYLFFRALQFEQNDEFYMSVYDELKGLVFNYPVQGKNLQTQLGAACATAQYKCEFNMIQKIFFNKPEAKQKKMIDKFFKSTEKEMFAAFCEGFKEYSKAPVAFTCLHPQSDYSKFISRKLKFAAQQFGIPAGNDWFSDFNNNLFASFAANAYDLIGSDVDLSNPKEVEEKCKTVFKDYIESCKTRFLFARDVYSDFLKNQAENAETDEAEKNKTVNKGKKSKDDESDKNFEQAYGAPRKKLAITRAVHWTKKHFGEKVASLLSVAATMLTGEQDLEDELSIRDLKANFTSLPDQEFAKLVKGTKDIDLETFLKGMDTIKQLVKTEDYKLFEQDLSAAAKAKNREN